MKAFAKVPIQRDNPNLSINVAIKIIKAMDIFKTVFKNVLVLEPTIIKLDSYNYDIESFSQRDFDEKVTPILGFKVNFCQDNESMSSYGVMRGFHFQKPPYTQNKLIWCVNGKVLDVVIDLRKESPTYGKHFSMELSAENHKMLFVPHGFAHGFCVLSPKAIIQYKCDEFYHPEAECGISILDNSLGIDWKIPFEHAILSEKDKKHVKLADFVSPF